MVRPANDRGDPMPKACLVLLPLLLAACTSTTPVHLANGQPALRVECSLAIRGLAACYEAAGDACNGRGYRLFDWSGTPFLDTRLEVEDMDLPGALADRRILIACRA
jgi:hypothetical protein